MYIDCLFVCLSASAYLPFFASFCLYTQGNYVNTHTHKNTTYSSIVMLDKIDYIYAYICIYMYIYIVYTDMDFWHILSKKETLIY